MAAMPVRDPLETHAGVVSEAGHTAMRADIRRLGDLLGDTLVRLESPDLLALVERVRWLSQQAEQAAGVTLSSRRHSAAVDTHTAELSELLSGVDVPTAMLLARSFSTFFQLANVAEQLHRATELNARRERDGGPLRQLVERLDLADDRPLIQATLARTELRPVFTAHPTEASRQSVLATLRRIADLLVSKAASTIVEPRLAELIDLLWLTDELRAGKASPVVEARAVTY
jgi:phosphoenolpyruvate carboxylase